MNRILLVALTAIMLFAGCADEGSITDAGGGNRSPNPVYGFVADNGAGLNGVTVDLYRINLDYDERDGYYFWQKMDSTVTDDDGYFGFDTIGGDPYAVAVLARKGGYGGFAGYFDRAAYEVDTLRIPDMSVARALRVTGTLMFSDKVIGKQIIVDGDTLYPFDSLNVSVNLVGTPFADTIGQDGSFGFRYLPAGTYKLRIRYNSRVIDRPDGSQLGLYAVHYTTFSVGMDNPLSYADDPYMLADSIAAAGDSAVISNDTYRLQYRFISE